MLKVIQLFVLLFIGSAVFATHNLAGDITYTHIGGLTYEFTVTIFADRGSPAVARRDIEINYGDNTGIDTLNEVSRTELTINGIQILKRTWIGTHTFSGSDFTYTISVEDPNRNANVVNIDNSVNTPFTIRSRLTISSFPGEINNSVQLRNDPLDNACVGATYVYNPGAFDPDRQDSIAYRIARSLGAGGAVAPMYTFPSASQSITVDPITGDLVWRDPDLTGVFNVGIEILEYRNGRNIGSVLRDIQIIVVPGCENNPPQILADQLVCVEAGSVLTTNIVGTDIDNDNVELSATGELFEQPLGSRTVFNSGVIGNPTNASFIWNTLCEDVRIQPYRLNVRAIDDAISRGQPTNLVNFQTTNIRVIAPPPINFNATPTGRNIALSWNNSNCNNGVGYYIYRKLDSSSFVPDSCTPGIPESIGFVRIDTVNSINTLSYIDDNSLVPGQEYCYRITSFFADGDESYSSLEVCAEIDKVIPVITNVSIDSTDINQGRVYLEWSPPTAFDAVAFPPPYRYLIYEANSPDLVNFNLIDSTNSLQDTSLLLLGRNTEENTYNYRVDLFSLGNGRVLAGQSVGAQSIFLSIVPTDQVLQLSWNVNTPWNDTSYTIFRRLPSSPTFDSLTTISSTSFNDSNLVNGSEYCYFIRATGFYNLNSVKAPLINLSQIACSSPIDNVSPCQVNFLVNGNCELGDLSISWELPDSSCPMDIAQYRIYKSSSFDGELVLIDSILDPTQTSYSQRNDTIAGCYSIAALDSARNESILGERQCIDYCPFYELPNIFTPNGDGKNDFFVPIPLNNRTDFRHVDSIELVVFSRWGTEVFTTKEPAINWSGERIGEEITQEAFSSIQQTASPVADGVFYYVCKVYERSLDPNTLPRILKGTITILDATNKLED